MLSSILVVVLVVSLLGAVPAWPHSRDWGYYPSGILGATLLAIVVLILTGTLR